MKTPSSKVLGLIFCGWLGLFWISYVFGGSVPEVMGGHRIAAYPDDGVATFSSDWLQRIAAWAVEHSPFRYRTIALRNRATYEMARALYPLPVNPGNSTLSIGRDGWLFFLEESPGDRTKRDLERMSDHAVWLAKTVRSSGRRFYLLPIPDKSSVYPEFVGPVLRKTDRYSRRGEFPGFLAQGFQNNPDLASCSIPLWSLFAEQKTRSQDLLYWEHDTHWTPAGMILTVQRLIDQVQPGLWEPESVREAGIVSHSGDLMRNFLLQDIATNGRNVEIKRGGAPPVQISSESVPGYGLTPITRYRSDHPRVIKGRTLIISDSFVEGAVPMLTPWFEDVTFVHFSYTGSDAMSEQLRHCDTLIFTSVERFLRWRLKAWFTGSADYLQEALARPVPAP